LNDTFRATFGRDPDITARAPGRVNLIGEHTDYNGGYVLPSALPQETVALLARRTDRRVRAYSTDLGPSSLFEFDLGGERRQHAWADYLQGVTWAIGERTPLPNGFDLLVSSSVPIGKGLSSSASLEVAVARAITQAFGLGFSGVEIAMIGHRAESEFVGAPVGIMDQMVCSLGDSQTALFLDTATIQFEKIPLPATAELGVIDSGIAHSHATGEYRTRRRECEDASRALGVKWLRDVSIEDLPRIDQLPPPLNRRARHVVTENARVLAAVDAMRRNDAETLGRLFVESHASMRDDFEVSLPDIDRLVEIAIEQPDTFGARLTGGGFGGAIVMLCRRNTAKTVTDRTLKHYKENTRRDGHVLLP
jgi:galactokinase